MLVEIKLTKPAGIDCGRVAHADATGGRLITATGIATWARLVSGNEVTASIWTAAAPMAAAT